MIKTKEQPLVGVLMGSKSDWEVMSHCVRTLDELGVPCEVQVLSAHRTPDETLAYAASAAERGLKVIVAAAGGAAHLAGVVAAKTLLPVLGVPMHSGLLGIDSLLSMVQMPAGIPVPTLAVGKAGAVNGALAAVAILALSDDEIRDALARFRAEQRARALAAGDPRTG